MIPDLCPSYWIYLSSIEVNYLQHYYVFFRRHKLCCCFPSWSRTPFKYKLDHIQRLDSTTYYLSWRNQVSNYLHVMDIYKYMGGLTHKATNTTYLATWTRSDYTSKAAIMCLLSEDFIYLASNTPTAKDAGQAVEDHRALWNSSTLHNLVHSCFPTKISDTNVCTDHVSSYEQKHIYTT